MARLDLFAGYFQITNRRSLRRRFATRIFAPLHGDNFCQDRDCNFFRCDCAKIETSGRLEFGEPLVRNTALDERGLQGVRFLSAADERNIIGVDRERRQEGSFIAAALRRDDDVAAPGSSTESAYPSIRRSISPKTACSSAGAQAVTAKPARLAKSATATATGLDPQMMT